MEQKIAAALENIRAVRERNRLAGEKLPPFQRDLTQARGRVEALGFQLEKLKREHVLALYPRRNQPRPPYTAGEKAIEIETCQKLLKKAKEDVEVAAQALETATRRTMNGAGIEKPYHQLCYEKVKRDLAGDMRRDLRRAFAAFCLARGEVRTFNEFSAEFLGLTVVETGHADLITKGEVLGIMEQLRKDLEAEISRKGAQELDQVAANG